MGTYNYGKVQLRAQGVHFKKDVVSANALAIAATSISREDFTQYCSGCFKDETSAGLFFDIVNEAAGTRKENRKSINQLLLEATSLSQARKV